MADPRPDAAVLAHRALCSEEPEDKARLAREAAQAFDRASARIAAIPSPPDRPARPRHPELVPPGQVKRRRLGSLQGRIALLHALAHIEFNAIDLALDMGLRFVGDIAALGLDGEAFLADWFGVADDEARHFSMIAARLNELGSHYGALAAHDGLWEAAMATADDVLARLAIAPLVLEARGLDVTPQLIEGLERANDEKSAEILNVIYRDEIGHVGVGVRWFEAVCRRRDEKPESAFRSLVEARFAGGLKPPFNRDARDRAGFSPAIYEAAC